MDAHDHLDHDIDLDLSQYTYENTIQHQPTNKVSVHHPSQPQPPQTLQSPHINDTIQKSTIVNIDSTNRRQTSTNILGSDTYRLPNNPIHTYVDSPIVELSIAGTTTIQSGDSIVVKNVCGQQVNLMSSIEFIPSSSFVKILLSHHYQQHFDQHTTQYVTLSQTGDNHNYGNVPWTIVNGKHKIYLTSTAIEQPTFDYFYIKLPILFVPNTITNSENNIYQGTCTIDINNINGIPVKAINADYPLDNSVVGNHVVQDVRMSTQHNLTTTIIKIDCTIPAIRDGIGGGDNIRITMVSKTLPAHPLPNQYSIPLSKTFHNIVKLEIIASEFPICTKLLYDTPEDKRNNNFYWQILKDGDVTYHASMQAGQYTPALFAKAFMTAVLSTPRTTSTITNPHMNDIEIDIDLPTNHMSMRAYDDITLSQPFAYNETTNTLVVSHDNHMLDIGDRISITNADEFQNIPADILNGSHVITNVVNTDKYHIVLPMHDKTTNTNANTTTTSNGGVVRVRFPVSFRILCKQDSIMGTLGFNNIGNTKAVTVFAKHITNLTPYNQEDQLDLYEDTMRTEIISNRIPRPMFVMEKYILMRCNDIHNINQAGSNDHYFSKINLLKRPENCVFNGHLKQYLEFVQPIQHLSSLDISFHYPDGSLYDFDKKNHSITFLITELLGTNDHQHSIDTRTGGNW